MGDECKLGWGLRRLGSVNVKSRARNLAGVECFKQGLGVDDSTASGTDDVDSPFHFSKGLFINQAAGFGCERNVEGDDV